MSHLTPLEDDEQEFLLLLAMLPEDERYAVVVELLDIAEKHTGSFHAD